MADRHERETFSRAQDRDSEEGYLGGSEWRGYGSGYARGGEDDWRRPGPHTGRGPRGYRRADERILEDVCERLAGHGQIDASDIEVQVSDGEVTLAGRAASRGAKRLAEDIAASVAGVFDVHNQLRVGQPDHECGESNEEVRKVQPGTPVVGLHGRPVGEVQDIESTALVVRRPSGDKVHIPFSAICTSNGQVVLNISSDQVDDQNWKI